MKNYNYVYGPVPSRRMGLSLGVSPIPQKYCNYSCVYCQLGRTKHMKHKRKDFFPIKEIVDEARNCLQQNPPIEGEPTLYLHLGELIISLKKLTPKPVAVITNGALLHEKAVREELKNADIVLPSLDACDNDTFKKVNRPFGKLDFSTVYEGLQAFSQEFSGQLWPEIMLVKGLNDSDNNLSQMKKLLGDLKYDRLYVNTPIRPPAESWVETLSAESMQKAADFLDGTSIDLPVTDGFFSEIEDDCQAINSIIKRHPMNQHEISNFLKQRGCKDITSVLQRLSQSKTIEKISYKGYETYRGISPA